ncbi:MAG: DNRLRE domain-containing protein [bacterium]
MKTLLFVCLFVAFFTLAIGPALWAQPSEVSIVASKDNTLYEDVNGALSNGIGPAFFVGKTNQGRIRRAVVQFDLAEIPEGATIQSVTLTLNLSRTNALAGAQTVSLHKVSADWGEGSSDDTFRGGGQGTAAADSDATWIHRFFDTDNWTTAGGDFDDTPSGSQVIEQIGSYTWESTAEMVADVQDWVENPAQNFGWILIGNESTNRTTKRFDSKDNATPDNRPVLTVTFLPPSSVEDGTPEIPSAIGLAQNYPNPFNPGTVIRYSVPQTRGSSVVRLEIYNLLGQKVKTLVAGARPAGSYAVEWDGRTEHEDLAPTGIYVYRLSMGEFIETRKMTLLR